MWTRILPCVLFTVGSLVAGAAVVEDKPANDIHSRALQRASVATLEVINTLNNTKLMDIFNSTIIDLAKIPMAEPSFNIRALVAGSNVRSVSFNLREGIVKTYVETTAPYALCGNQGDIYKMCPELGLGRHTVTVTVNSCDRQRRCSNSPPVTLSFVIVDSRRTKAPAPIVTNAPTKTPTKAPTKAPTKIPTRTPTKAPIPAFSIKINCGGEEYSSPTSGVWMKDTYFDQNSTTVAFSGEVDGTEDDGLYHTERYSYSTVQYTIPVLTTSAAYTVTLHFAELAYDGVGQRKFDVKMEGALVFDDVDLFQIAGAFKKITQTKTVVVTDGILTIDLIAVVNVVAIAAIEVTLA